MFKKLLDLKYCKLLLIVSLILNAVFSFRYVMKSRYYKEAYQSLYTMIVDDLSPKNTPPEVVQSLYQLMKDTHEILEDYDVHYFADGGTLLGSVRHGGFIPWDDDLDIAIPIEDELKLHAAFEDFKKLGYYIVDWDCCYKIYSTKPSKWKGPSKNPPSLDIFVVYKAEDGFKYHRYYARKWFNYIIKEEDLGQRKLASFGDLKIWIPEKPASVLDVIYPKGWADVAYQTADHLNEKEVMNYTFSLKEYPPALPPHPLEDRYIKRSKN